MVSKGRPARGRLYNLWSPQRQTDTNGSHAAQSRAQHSHRSAALNRGRWHRGIPHISVDLPSHLRRRRGYAPLAAAILLGILMSLCLALSLRLVDIVRRAVVESIKARMNG